MDREFTKLCRQQGGVFTGRQALAHTTRSNVRWNIDTGRWVKVLGTVYRLREEPPTPAVRLSAARLYLARPDPVLSHDTAAEVHGISVRHQTRTHVLVPDRRHTRAKGVAVHCGPVAQGDVVEVGGVACTNAARTAVDLARTLDRGDGLAVLDRAARLHAESGGRAGVSLEQLRQEAARHAHQPGIRAALGLLALADPGAASVPESWTRLRCVDFGLPRPRTQVRVRTPAGERFLDLGWEDEQVGLEYDSHLHHSGGTAVRRDLRRHNALTHAGWLVFYADPQQVRHQPEAFLAPVRAALRQRGRRAA